MARERHEQNCCSWIILKKVMDDLEHTTNTVQSRLAGDLVEGSIRFGWGARETILELMIGAPEVDLQQYNYIH